MKRWRSAMIMMMTTAVWPSKAGSTATPGVSKLQKTMYQTWTNLDDTYAARDEISPKKTSIAGKVSWFNIGIPEPPTVRILGCVFWFKMVFSVRTEEKSSENRFHLKCMWFFPWMPGIQKSVSTKKQHVFGDAQNRFPLNCDNAKSGHCTSQALKSWPTDVTTVRQKSPQNIVKASWD